jgi:hypothetical protein
MAMTNIFKPIRYHLPDPDEAAGRPHRDEMAESGDSRANRMGVQPVTNTLPSGPSAAPAPVSDEDAWLAMLEIVFAETGWPDA